MTADQSSGSPKRVVRRRTKKVDATESSEMRETGLTDSQSVKPLIEDVLDEIAAVRRESEGYPTEKDMDFEALDAEPAPRRARARRADSATPVPATERPRRGRPPRAAAVQTETASTEVPPVERAEPESFPAPTREPRDLRERRESREPRELREAAESLGDSRGGDNRSSGESSEFVTDEPRDASAGSGPFPTGAEGYPTGPEGFQDGGPNRRRRRRRGRGRGPAGQAEGGGGNYSGPPNQQQQRPPQARYNQPQGQGGGYGQQQGRGQRRPPQDNRRGQYNGHSNSGGNGRPYSEPRGNQDRDRSTSDTVTLVQGILELHPKGYGFLRDPKAGYISQETDSFVSGSLLEKYGIREGVLITGESIPGGRGQGPRLRSIQSIEGRLPEQYAEIKNFDALTPINPHVQIKLETGSTPITMRVMDLLTPIGKGQRALIVAPPRTGKTMLLQEIADSVSTNYPEIYLIVLLIDERPEEVTEMRRRVKGEVVASSLDREVENHIRVSQLVFERAKRMAEAGRDVFVLLDSITRTARAFNKWTNTGRTGTGGLDVKAMDLPKKMFGMARQFDEGGSMTVVGTALIETGSRMDEAIFLEFKGTGNMEMVLSRDLAERRIWPAIDISKSGTRREEKILPPEVLEGVTLLRRSLVSLSPVEAMEQLTRILQKYPTNADFLAKVRSIL
ncbi:MAG: transcription termination factor Rho [Schlesneria sp.]